MGLLNWFRKPKPAVPLPQLCYDVAYFILPHYAFKDMAKLADLCLNTPTAAGPFFYFMAAQARKVEPDIEDAKRFHWHHGQLDEGREYFALEYPPSPPVDMSAVPIEQVMRGGALIVLAPHFSAIIRGVGGVQYFILGQAPMGGGTTLRCILPEGSNCNLGPGPEPQLSAFLDAVRGRGAKYFVGHLTEGISAVRLPRMRTSSLLAASLIGQATCWVFVLGHRATMNTAVPQYLFGFRISHELSTDLALMELTGIAVSGIAAIASCVRLIVRGRRSPAVKDSGAQVAAPHLPLPPART